ncbi:MAG: helix-turn-helix transcriptional regulator [Candidatus Gastranaerophilaceae bacterium]
MIKSEHQKNITLKRIKEFKKHLNDLDEWSSGSVNSIIGQLEQELEEYERLKKGEYTLPKNIPFGELLKCIAKVRISKGLSQQDLANLLGLTKQQINRYEEYDYQNVSLSKINEILEVLGLTVSLEHFKKAA